MTGSRIVLVFALVALPFVASCGAVTPERRADVRPDPAVEMDEQEARLRQARDELQRAGQPCESQCHAGASICDAARRICDLASELGDDRSHARCESASASCLEANQSLTACHCAHDVPDAGRVKR